MSSLGASVQPGLTADEAAQRLIADGPNELPTAVERNLLRQAWDVVREPMLLLLLGAGTVNFALAEPVDGAILMSFVLVVIGISIYQEHKTERALTALRELSSPRALVVRDGVQVRVAGRDVVRGDCLLLAEGDRVPADAVLVDCVNFSVDESALTGEAVPVRKAPRRDASTTMGEAGGDGSPPDAEGAGDGSPAGEVEPAGDGSADGDEEDGPEVDDSPPADVSRDLLSDIMYRQKAIATENDRSTRRCLTMQEALRYNVVNVRPD